MKISKEGILAQLGYNVNDNSIKQLENIEKNTSGFENIKKHIIALNDHLKHLQSYVAMSNSNPYFKIKIDAKKEEFVKEAKDIIQKWSNKYNVELQKVQNRETYYIVGIKT